MLGKSKVSKYYDYTLPFWKVFWHQGLNTIHFGFWDKSTKNDLQALLNTNSFLAKKTMIKENDYILDAGCGVGGSAVWLAKNYKTRVTGISISQKQVIEARKFSKNNKVNHLVNFELMDYTNTRFNEESFDVVWAIESVCYAYDKSAFIKEAHRVLKRGGRLIIADGFAKKGLLEKKEKKLLNSFNEGFAVDHLVSINKFSKLLSKAGFHDVNIWDKTKSILPSVKRAFLLSVWSYPLSKITQALKLTSPILTKNNLAGLVSKACFEKRIITYQVIYAKK